MKHKLALYLKSLIITALSLTVLVGFCAGILQADGSISKTMGINHKTSVSYDSSDDTVDFSLFGNDYSLDISGWQQTATQAKQAAAYALPAFYLVCEAISSLFTMF